MRDQFIPVRKSELVAALLAERPPEQAASLRQLCRILGSIFHYEYFAELDALKDAYFHFNPQHAGKAGRRDDPATYAEFSAALRRVLTKANFTEVPAEEVERAYRETALTPVEVHAPVEDYRDIRFFRRGQHREQMEIARWFGYRRRSIAADVYDEVVLIAASKPTQVPGDRKQRKRVRRGRPPEGVLIKYFRDIASADLNTLLPNARVIMNARDKWLLGLPALFGGIPLVLKLAPTLAVLFVLIGIRLGYTGAMEQDRLQQALAVMSGVIALGSFVIHQWLKYQRQALRYQIEINEAIYFRNLNNNAGIFDAIIGSAEEQEVKEALLAYFFLLGSPQEQDALDGRIEKWLDERFGLKVDFEVDDGVAKLERLGLLVRNAGLLSVPPVNEALARLDRLWDGFFRFDQAAE